MWIELNGDVVGHFRKTRINKYHITSYYNTGVVTYVTFSNGKSLCVKESYDEITKLLEGGNDAKCE